VLLLRLPAAVGDVQEMPERAASAWWPLWFEKRTGPQTGQRYALVSQSGERYDSSTRTNLVGHLASDRRGGAPGHRGEVLTGPAYRDRQLLHPHRAPPRAQRTSAADLVGLQHRKREWGLWAWMGSFGSRDRAQDLKRHPALPRRRPPARS